MHAGEGVMIHLFLLLRFIWEIEAVRGQKYMATALNSDVCRWFCCLCFKFNVESVFVVRLERQL